MDTGKKLEKTFSEFQKVANEHKEVDVAALMINALDSHHNNLVSASWKRWAYGVSLLVPPFGFLFALKFFIDEKDDAKTVAWTCVVLTVISVALFYIVMQAMLPSGGSGIEQIRTGDITQVLQ